ncbi:MAG: LemA family protein [Steroidobacteraceae bacterium]
MSFIPFLVLLAFLIWAILLFNRLVRLRNQVRAGWSDIGVQLTRRHDLVPMLVDAVRAYAGHEKSVFESVTALRTKAMATSTPTRLATVEAALEHEVDRLMLIKEAYPDLKASENFLRLQRDLVEVEDHLQYARRFYNGAVRELNDGVQRFPDLLVANAFGFKLAEFFEAAESADVAPKLDLER